MPPLAEPGGFVAIELRPPPVLFGRQGSESSEDQSLARAPGLALEELPGDPRLLCEDRARHALFSLRLRRDYLLYCFVCFVLATVACTSTIGHVLRLRHEGQAISAYRRKAWEATLEVATGMAVIAETLSTLWLSGRRVFLRDCWCVFDAGVVALTLLEWSLQLLRWALLAEELLGVDLALLAFRFVLQPCRMLTAVSMVRRVRKMQEGVVDVVFDALGSAEDHEPAQPAQHVLSRALQAEISAHLPAWCRFREWRLAYLPKIHGSSLPTFYRSQATCGPNVVLLQTTQGAVIGGFVPEGWRTCPPGSCRYGTGDCFVFACGGGLPAQHGGSAAAEGGEAADEKSGHEEPLSPRQPVFFHARGCPEVLLWGDSDSLSLDEAISVMDDFRFGSTSACEAFGSPALVRDASDFSIAAFECWELV